MVRALVIGIVLSLVINALILLDWFIVLVSEPPRKYECTGIEGIDDDRTS